MFIILVLGCGQNATYGLSSNCKYKYEFSLKSAEPRKDNKIKKSAPCTNRPVLCAECLNLKSTSYFWSYNLKTHYNIHHSNIQIPSIAIISEEEKSAVKNLFKRK